MVICLLDLLPLPYGTSDYLVTATVSIWPDVTNWSLSSFIWRFKVISYRRSSGIRIYWALHLATKLSGTHQKPRMRTLSWTLLWNTEGRKKPSVMNFHGLILLKPSYHQWRLQLLVYICKLIICSHCLQFYFSCWECRQLSYFNCALIHILCHFNLKCHLVILYSLVCILLLRMYFVCILL